VPQTPSQKIHNQIYNGRAHIRAKYFDRTLAKVFMTVFATFVLLTALTFAIKSSRRAVLSRKAQDWMIDATGLIVQGLAIPILQITFVYWLFSSLFPQAKGSLAVSPVAAFLLNFIVVDYLYYWNHRLLHGKALWDTHAVHHTAEHLDLFITSRNTLWTSLLIIYLWANGLFIFLLQDPHAFIFSASLTASLDLWRHTPFFFTPHSILHRTVGLFLITPNEHAWHHSADRSNKNFGANLPIWDRLHGTYYSPDSLPQRFGIASRLDVKRKLLFPFPMRKAGQAK
jgi:sterol desaturase/sphingolipid hydroxylase (fatty acid hydroxylase superfamily)